MIVCPATLKENWRREAHKWAPNLTTHIVNGRMNGDPLPKADLYIVNYDVVAVDIEKDDKIVTVFRSDLMNLKPQAVVLDESHYVKNRSAKRTKAILSLTKKVPHRIALSGTPIINRPAEFFNTLRFISPERFTSFWKFAERYCGAHQTPFGWDTSGATNTEELHQVLTDTVMIRRTKAEVLKDLPPKVRSIVPIPMTDSSQYDAAEDAMMKELAYVFGDEEWQLTEVNPDAETLTTIERLKQAAVAEKLPSAIQWIRDYLEEADKLVVYTTHQKTIDILEDELGAEFNSVRIDGRTPVKSRDIAVQNFQHDPTCRLFIGNIKAAGVGITLTAANATCFLELGWTPGEHDQAEDRVHRIGQEADSVMAYYLVAESTIEEEIAALLDSKRKVLAQVLDGENVEEESLLTALLRKIRG
jgi:SNF2 family DNA or RNA helicase